MEALPPPHGEPAAIHAVPAELGPSGFRLLALREFREAGPPAFALVEQHLLRAPHRLNRHGVSFALTFRPEVMAALSALIGRPCVRDGAGRPARNPLWPGLGWQSAPRTWADGTRTVEWCANVHFPDAAAWSAFRARFALRLAGWPEAPVLTGDPP